MKKLLSLALALCLILALACPAFAAETYPPNTFQDVPRDKWYTEAVDFAQYRGIMNGVGDDRFDPDGSVTRAMVVTVLYRMADSPDVEGLNNPFQDVPSKCYYRDAVLWAVDQGVTKGDGSADVFSPNKPITREQMATMIFRFLISVAEMSETEAAQIEMIEENNYLLKDMLARIYSDADAISSWARVSVYICNQAAIMQGDSAGTFRPNATLSRAECAKVFLNLYRSGETQG